MWCELYLKAVKRRSNVNEQVEIQCLTVLKNLNLCRLKQNTKKKKVEGQATDSEKIFTSHI